MDIQNDFCPGGALAVSAGDKIIFRINKYIKIFSQNKLPIFASRDWHPEKTKHFKKFGGAWPIHCVQGTEGAKFHPKLDLPKKAILLYKGMDPEKDSYSAFQAEDKEGNSFLKLLKTLRIKEIYIGGLATDYCVKFSALDGLKNGFKVKLLTDAIKGVSLKPTDSQQAIKEMLKQGVKKISLKEGKIL